jgi:23S rRNA (guanosine2251-2'-O)-methyltransferase
MPRRQGGPRGGAGGARGGSSGPRGGGGPGGRGPGSGPRGPSQGARRGPAQGSKRGPPPPSVRGAASGFVRGRSQGPARGPARGAGTPRASAEDSWGAELQGLSRDVAAIVQAHPPAVAYGIHAVRALLTRSPQRVRLIWLGFNRESAPRLVELRQLAEAGGVQTRDAEDGVLDRMAAGERHQGVVAEIVPRAADPETLLEEALESMAERPPLLLVLDGVTDPHNLGACLRSADAAGVAAVVAPRDRAAGLSPVVRKVAAGAAESVPFIAVVNLARTLRELKERGVWLVGTDDEAERTLFDVDMTGPTAVVMGSEGEGLRRLTREACDELVRIPMGGAVESLNVSVAAGVALFEAVRQRRAKG